MQSFVNFGQGELVSSGSKGIPGIRKARTAKKEIETMMIKLDKLRPKEFTICSVDEFVVRRDATVRSNAANHYATPPTTDVTHVDKFGK